ncbi:MAG: hypothetical protein ABFS56_22845 [Pseudomonadota bacterium]
MPSYIGTVTFLVLSLPNHPSICLAPGFRTEVVVLLEGINLNADEIISNAALTEGDYLRSWRERVLKCSELSAQCFKIVNEDVSKLLDYLNSNMSI